MSSEFNNSAINNTSCSYRALATTYPANGSYTVPNLCSGYSQYPPAYNTLSHGNRGQCGTHFSFASAYPDATCTSCNIQYGPRPCSGVVHCNENNTSESYSNQREHRSQRGATESFCGSCRL